MWGGFDALGWQVKTPTLTTQIAVTVVARKTVRIDVEHNAFDDPTDLTSDERREAFEAFALGQDATMEIERVEECK